MVNNNNATPPDEAREMAARQALDQLRNRLLDLTARNRLLNFRHSRTSSLRVVDEFPDQLLGLLLDNKELRFAPVPLPTRDQLIEGQYLAVDPETSADVVLRESPAPAEWASYLGLSVDYELPVPDAHGAVQTRLSQAELFSAADEQGVGTEAGASTRIDQTDDVSHVSVRGAVAEPETKPEVTRPARAAKHSDLVIQTLLYPEDLEALVRNLYQKAESAVQEMGTNILYLSFGFLEWSEADKSDVTRIAPLLLLPVTINKGRLNKQAGTFEYRLSYSGEDIVANLSLLEKLRNDFGLALPPLTDEDAPNAEQESGPSAEAYLKKIAGIIKRSKPDWCVRRYVTLSLLNFNKLLMYLDLDPDRWPEQGKLANHPVVAQFLGAERNDPIAAADGFSREHDIDQLPRVHSRYPIIYDADSSQHSAIIDVLDGNSLVIEGPPGTGKSQSITNLIAAAISDGKRVLFVAEKLAALQVVKSRLDRAGLGDFCLELHSHKTQKRQFLNAIEERLSAHGEYRDAAEIEADINRYEKQKLTLKAHVELINSDWKNTGLTPFRIFTAATRYRDSLPVTLLQLADDTNDVARSDIQFTVESRQLVRDKIDRYKEIFHSMETQVLPVSDEENTLAPGLSMHPWYGVRRNGLMHQETNRFTQALTAWQQVLLKLTRLRDSLSDQLQCSPADVGLSVDSLEELVQGLQSLPPLSANIRQQVLPRLEGAEFSACRDELRLFERMHDAIDALLPTVKSLVAEDTLPVDLLKRCAENLRYRLQEEITLGEAGQLLEVTSDTIARGDAVLLKIQQAATDVAPKAQTILGHSSIESIEQTKRFLSVLESLDITLSDKRHHRFENAQLDPALQQLTVQVASVHQQKDALSSVFDIRKLGDHMPLLELQETLDSGGLLGWLKSDWRSARVRLKAIAATESVSLRTLRESLEAAIRFSRECAGLNHHAEYTQLFGAHYKGVNTDVAGLQMLRHWYQRVATELPDGLARALMEIPLSAERKLRAVMDQGALDALRHCVKSVRGVRHQLLPGDLLHNDDTALLGEQGALKSLSALLAENVSASREMLGSDNITIADFNDQLDSVETFRLTQQQWDSRVLADSALGRVFETDINSLRRNSADHGAIVATLFFVEALEQCNVCPAVVNTILQSPQQYTLDELHDISLELQSSLVEYNDKKNEYMQIGDVSEAGWLLHCGSDLQLLAVRNNNALKNETLVPGWMSYLSAAGQMTELGLTGVSRCCERGELSVDQYDDAWLAMSYDQLARELLRESPSLAQFSGDIQQTLREQFAQTDLKIQILQRERIAWKADQNKVPEGVSGAYVRDLTELKLLRHECNKKTRHIPIRQLLSRAARALVQLKPCFMMGPLSAAQYLQPGQLEFDLVIMDEASQIKPEDSLGVIARGSQLVVVGDPKQLPPTNFFDRVVEDEDEDVTVLGEQESILDATIPMFNRRRLRWHYRSQHESLIAFSNQNFYDNDLVLFPSPARQSEEFGVKHRVVNGLFVGRTNVQEAEAIADAVASHFQNYPGDSVGVVAMNSNQRQLIDATIEAKAKSDVFLREALEQNLASEEPLFVKNLENVQGDERDVILISMTYGPAKEGARVYQRFGPINSETGWRRLNVLLTRSRKRMQVFTSMASSDIVAGESSKRGVVALRDLLAYLETGIVHNTRQSGRQPDSDFEIAVIDRLERLGYTCVPQIGVAGFFIDIAVVDPSNEGHYLMGIECDGAAYHSARTVRDRDRLREAVLERLGWRIRRIWSTDWFRNPDSEIQRVVHELERLSPQVEVVNAPRPDFQENDVADIEVQQDSAVDLLVTNETQETATDQSLPLVKPVVDLQQELITLARQIEQEFPDHSGRQRLLRASMQEALLEFRPLSVEEFESKVPHFLRRSIADAETEAYLLKVLNLIDSATT